jgi:predicted lipoprotein with Yx(FWY)xxD motif
MRQITRFVVPALAASALLAACGSSSSGTSSKSGATTKSAAATASAGTSVSLVKTASNSTVGKTVLIAADGRTLYSLSGEHAGKWICTSHACLKAWPPLVAKAGSSPRGSVPSLGTVKRPGGITQVTYKGMPLYTFVGDRKPGDAKGQGIKDRGSVWTADTTAAASSAAPATSTTSSSSSGGGYGY